ncbi:hypothetical protein [Flavobacterium marginilacus]|uniref:hypothetical protein n=1 Tax=Flavobacterium marginilacus TaxID=3003256 RepID=UPI00248DDD4A|nr:hypothetical protein [Flavobacterium marginilacus]
MIEEHQSENIELQQLEDFEFFESAIDDYILEIEALAETLPLTLGLLSLKLRGSQNKLNKFIEKNTSQDEDGKKTFKIPLDQFNLFNRLDTDHEIATTAMDILPRTLIVALVSQYDAYLGNLYRAVFEVKPELAYSLEKDFSFQDILKYNDINEIKAEVIEKDVEKLLRESHYEQFKILERRITKLTGKEFTLTTNLPILPTFIEVAERRNLFVHTNGIVSQQYIDNCKKHKVKDCDKINFGDVLDVDPHYFDSAYKANFEIGVKLCQVLWRKFLPHRLVEADKNLNNICFDLIYNGYYDIAKVLLKFATEEIKKNGNDEMRKTFVINKALAHYLDNDKKTTDKILDSEDFSLGNEFKLAVAVLKENYEDSKKWMLKIGTNDEMIGKEEYQEWPLFKVFRETDIFKETYKELFQEDFLIRESSKKSFKSLLDDINKKKEKNFKKD